MILMIENPKIDMKTIKCMSIVSFEFNDNSICKLIIALSNNSINMFMMSSNNFH